MNIDNEETRDIDDEFAELEWDYYERQMIYEEEDKERRKEFEESLIREDVVDYYLSLTNDDLDYKLGSYVTRMVGFEQKNSHHCYDLWEHTLRTVEGIKQDGLTDEQYKTLRLAAFFHDIGKPDVAKFNEKTGQQVFYGHAARSAEISDFLLGSFGYSQEEIDKIGFYIGHHDDFISYKSSIPDKMKNHEFIREINVDSIAEKIIENRYDFEKMGYNKDQVRAIVYTLVHGEEPEFKDFKGNNISIPINIEEVKEKIISGEYNYKYTPSLKDYQMLLKLCKADAGAQAEKVEKTLPDGRVVVEATKEGKIENMNKIENYVQQAYEKVDNIINLDFQDRDEIRKQELVEKILETFQEGKDLDTQILDAKAKAREDK